jgi:dehydrogenase/reductase SDR family member 7B
MRFRDKVVWVTGASSGIGEALAIAFSREGARVVLSSRNEKELERVRKACDDAAASMATPLTRPSATLSPLRGARALQPEPSPLQPEPSPRVRGEGARSADEGPAQTNHLIAPLDLTQQDAIARVTADVLRKVGHVDVLVHSGGVSQRSLAADTTLATDRAIMDLNFFGTVALTKAVLPSMLARRSGHIVPISSVVAYVGTPLRSAYSASKRALHGFFDSLRAEVAKDGIDVTIVCPGYIRTNVSRNALTGDGSAFGQMDRTHDRAMLPEECARRIVNAVAKRKQELVVGGKETWAVPLQRFTPRLVARMVRMK